MSIRASALAITVVALLLAGCSGDDDDPTAGFTVRASTTVTTGALAKPQFVARVNALCREGWTVILDNFHKYSGWPDQARLSEENAFAKSVRLSFLAGFDFHVFDEIYDLGGPPGEEEEVEEVIGALQLAVELGQRRVRIESAAELTELFAEYNRLARAYGLRDCLVSGDRVKRVQS